LDQGKRQSFLKGAANGTTQGGTTGGATTHTHTDSGHTHAENSHTHTISIGSVNEAAVNSDTSTKWPISLILIPEVMVELRY